MSEVGEARDPSQPAEAVEGNRIVPAEARAEIEGVLSALRQWLLDAEQWRSEAARQSAAPEPDAPSVDFHTVVSEWIALKQEVRLEARGTKASRERLDQAVGAFHDGLDHVHHQLQRALDPLVTERDRLRDELQGELESQQRTWVDLLLDVRDALARAAEASRQAGRRVGWRRWFLPRDLHGSLLEGYELALRRIDAALESRDIRPIECAGQRLDPRRMRVVDVVQRDDLPEGCVVEVVRRGYVKGTRVIRFAEVRAVGQRKNSRNEDD